MADTFNGFPDEAFTFFKQLARNNNRDWFQTHRETYEGACREPMKRLIAALGADPARSKITRINRDMRFARGRDPYRTHIAAGVGDWYLSLSAEGLYIGAGLSDRRGRPSSDSATRSTPTRQGVCCRGSSRCSGEKAIVSTPTNGWRRLRADIAGIIRALTSSR